jgi:hypothetical protein
LPTVVIAGAWNPAIFSPDWIGRYVLGRQLGDVLPVLNVIFANPPGRSAVYYETFGILASNERVDFYTQSIEEQDIKSIEEKCIKILQLLPHTPVSAVGINFLFSQDNIDDEIIDKFKTKEGLNEYRTILNENLTTGMQFKDDLVLNLSRHYGIDWATFNFNYHHACESADAASRMLSGAIMQCYKDAIELLNRVYGLAGVETIAHQSKNAIPGRLE